MVVNLLVLLALTCSPMVSVYVANDTIYYTVVYVDNNGKEISRDAAAKLACQNYYHALGKHIGLRIRADSGPSEEMIINFIRLARRRSGLKWRSAGISPMEAVEP